MNEIPVYGQKHALDKIAPKPALHGEQCGVGTIMMMYLHGGNWQEIREALKKIGAPVTAEELGIEDKYIIEALLHEQKFWGANGGSGDIQEIRKAGKTYN